MIVLERVYEPGRTPGVLHVYHSRSFPTDELPWRGNRLNVSCIPEGRYTLLRDLSGHQKWYAFRDAETAPRRSIEIHPLGRLEGCIGMALEDLRELLGMMPNGDIVWIRSETGPINFER